jgi:tRNA U34 5-carboxymethylaminomethyl modifying GTPase MnmE/TrmE
LTRARKSFQPQHLFYTPIFDQNGRLLDRAMACFMRAPRTFTGEDSAELYLHGSRAVVQAVCATLEKIPGLEAARAGEFTRRFLLYSTLIIIISILTAYFLPF